MKSIQIKVAMISIVYLHKFTHVAETYSKEKSGKAILHLEI